MHKLSNLSFPDSKEEYIKSLNIKLDISSKILNEKLNRIEQLFNKTNQFNNTHIRYRKSELKSYQERNQIFTLEYLDKWSSKEICGCLIYQIKNDKLFILSYVLSCRFFSRGLEYVFVSKLIEILKSKNLKINISFKKAQNNKPFYYFLKKISPIIPEWEEMANRETINYEISETLLNENSFKFIKLYNEIKK